MPQGGHGEARSEARSGLAVGARPSAALGITAALVAASPLVVDPKGWFVYLPLRWLVMVLAVGAISLAVWRSGRSFRLPASRWWAALLGVAALSAVASSAPQVALVGANDRLEGAATWVLHAALAAVGASVVRHRRDLGVLARAMCVGLLGVAAVTLAQRSGWDFPSGATSFERPGGPFGNANFLGAYCVLALLVAFGVLLDRDQTARWRSVAVAAIPAGIATVVLSGSRSSWLALLFGASVMTTAWVRRGSVERSGETAGDTAPGERRRRTVVALAGVVAVAGLSVLVGGAAAVGDRLGDLTGGTARGRVDTWVTALDVVARRPALGWGPEGFAEGVTGSIDAGWEQRYGRRLTPDRAHNGVLDIASTVGVLGLGAYAGVLLLTGHRVRRAVTSDRRTAAGQGHSTTALGVGVGLAAYLVHQQMLFPLFDVDGLAWLFAGGLAALVPDGRPAPARTSRLGLASSDPVDRSSRRWIAAAALVVWTALVVTGVNGVVADRQARAAADSLGRGEAAQAMDHAAASLGRSPGQVLPALLLADAAEAVATEEALARGIAAVQTTRQRGFDDGRLELAEARLLVAAGDDSSLRTAARLLREQLAHDPARSEAWLMLGDLRAARFDGVHPGSDAPPAAAAVGAWEQARRLRPTWAEPLERLAPAYAALGRDKAALAALEQIDASLGPGRTLPVQLELLRARLEVRLGR